MPERLKPSDIVRIVVAGSLVGTMISSCKPISLNGIEKETESSIEPTFAPQELVEQAERLNNQNRLSNFLIDQNNSGELALFSKTPTGLWEYGALREKRGVWVIAALTTEGKQIEIEIDDVEAVAETPGRLVIDAPEDAPTVELEPHIMVPILPGLPSLP